MKRAALALAFVIAASPAYAQLGGIARKIGQAKDAKDTFDALNMSEAQERQLGEQVSALVRQEFGVLQDQAVTKYVTLVGSVLAQASTRPGLKWEFIVLDTDGVNAFAVPGGIVHITRGALGARREVTRRRGDLLGDPPGLSGRRLDRAHRLAEPVQRIVEILLQRREATAVTSGLAPRQVALRQSADHFGDILEGFFRHGADAVRPHLRWPDGRSSADHAGIAAPLGYACVVLARQPRGHVHADESGSQMSCESDSGADGRSGS